jgi:hypothetical protein
LGDLTFTRASDATRTNSAGVIERTPWNLLTQSVWTGGGSNVAPTGWASFLSSGNFAPSTTTNGNVSYRFFATSGRSFLTQTLIVVTGQQLRLSAFVESVTTATTLSDVFALIGASFSGAKFYVDDVEVIGTTLITSGKRIAYSATATTSATATIRVGGGQTGATTYDFVISRPQLVEGTDEKPYFATTNRQDVPRLDYRNADGTVSTCPRLLLEPQRTNSIRNSTMVGAVAGTPGTAPTNWSTVNGGLSRSFVAVGTENGLQYIDLRFQGIAIATSAYVLFDSSTQIVAANGQNWSESFWLKVVNASTNGYQAGMIERTSGGGTVKVAQQTIVPTSSLERFTYSRALDGGATVAAVQPALYFTLTIGETYDFTIRIAAPQMELGAYATTFIPTTTAAVTRLADAARKTGISSLIGQTEGTMFAEFIVPSLASAGTYTSFKISDGTSNNKIDFAYYSTGRIQAAVLVGGSLTVNIDLPSYGLTVGTHKVALAYKLNDYVLFVDGALAGSDTSSAVPATSELDLFGGVGATSNYNQTLLFKTRLTNARLAAITTL